MKFVPAAISRKVAGVVLKTQKNSPQILFGAGVVGVVGTVVLASKATLKLEEVLDEGLKDQEKARTLHARNRADYTDGDFNRDMRIIQGQTAINVVRLYAPAVVLGVVSVGCLAQSHRILTKRNTALMAAYTSLETAFENYRQRVKDELGDDREREIYYDIQPHAVEDPISGKIAKVGTAGANGSSPYAVIFDQTNRKWEEFPEYNRIFLEAQQQYANDILRSRGHLTLNEVYRSLGFEDTKPGFVVGWKWNGDGDNFVDFGLGEWPGNLDYVHGREGAILLDFNVDGVIYDKI